jgi:WD repeat-containing protein 26
MNRLFLFLANRVIDSRIYIWDKEDRTLLKPLEGHISGCVNAVACIPKDPSMFASAGDDQKVRM